VIKEVIINGKGEEDDVVGGESNEQGSLNRSKELGN
jgi:hypothetical protein